MSTLTSMVIAWGRENCRAHGVETQRPLLKSPRSRSVRARPFAARPAAAAIPTHARADAKAARSQIWSCSGPCKTFTRVPASNLGFNSSSASASFPSSRRKQTSATGRSDSGQRNNATRIGPSKKRPFKKTVAPCVCLARGPGKRKDWCWLHLENLG